MRLILPVLIAGVGAALFPIREPHGLHDDDSTDDTQEGEDSHAA